MHTFIEWGDMKKNRNFEVEFGKEWERVTDAVEVRQGFLHYELKDGTIGLARPGTWRRYQIYKDVARSEGLPEIWIKE